MFCTNCGKEIDDASRFCPYCGASMEIEELQDDNNVYEEPRHTYDNSTQYEEGEPSNKKALIIGGIVLLLAVIGVSAYLLGKKDDSPAVIATTEATTEQDTTEESEVTTEATEVTTATTEVTTEATTQAANDSSYILPGSDSSYLGYSDIKYLSSYQLKLARNEIYARHGRLFNDAALQEHFNNCTWYDGHISPSSFNEDVLNDYEKSNIKFIKKYE